MYAARSGPSGRFLYHFPAVTEGDRKMMQLEKMNISFFRRVLTLSTPRAPRNLRSAFLVYYLLNRFFPNRFLLEQQLLTQSILAKHFLLRQPLRRHFPRFP